MAKQSSSPQGRPSWSGMLRFGLVSFPIEAYNAHVEQAGAVRFHQLHRVCHSRIRYEKHCPLHGRVSNDEIVSGYEVGKDQYVEVEPDELKALKSVGAAGLTIDAFVGPAEIDPIYFDGRMYLLVPEGTEAEEAFHVFREGLLRTDRYGLGRVMLSGRDQLTLLRPYQGLLHLAMLNHAVEIRAADKLPAPARPQRLEAKKIHLAEQLIESWTQKEFDFTDYEDEHLKKVRQLVDAKVAGEEIVADSAEDEPPQVVNLMDALRASLKAKGPAAAKRTAPKRASARARRPAKSRGRKAS